MKSTAAEIILILCVFAFGCNPQRAGSATPVAETGVLHATPSDCDPKPYTWNSPNNLPVSPLSLESVTWDSYQKPYSVPETEISKISTEYVYAGFGVIKRCYDIKLSWKKYKTRDGVLVDKEKVRELAESLENLRMSGGTKGCINHYDDYPNFRVEIEYNTGRKAVLYSQTNCTSDRSPWNVVYDGKMYFQSTGEIPQALYELFASFDNNIDDWWNPDLAGTVFTGSGSEFSLVSYSHPPEIDRLTFSEENLFMDAIVASGALDSYLSKLDMTGISISCPMHTDCSDVTGQARLKSENGFSYLVDVRFAGGKVILEDGITVDQFFEADQKLAIHPILQTARSANPQLKVYVDCWVEKECNDQAWCAGLYAGTGLSPTADELACNVKFRMDYQQEYVFLPGINQFWVKQSLFELDTNASEKRVISFPDWKPGIDSLTNLFNVRNDTFLQDYAHSLRVDDEKEQCNRISLNYDNIAWDNGSVHRFRYRLADQYGYDRVPEGGINILGYCVFISPDGEFVLYEP